MLLENRTKEPLPSKTAEEEEEERVKYGKMGRNLYNF
jgi:hypothetical protein